MNSPLIPILAALFCLPASARVIDTFDVVIQTPDQRFLRAKRGTLGAVTTDSRVALEEQTFELRRHDDGKIDLFTHHRRYLRAEGGGGGEVFADRTASRGHERFTMEGDNVAGPVAFGALRTRNGRYLAVDGDRLTATATEAYEGRAQFRILRLDASVELRNPRVVEATSSTTTWVEGDLKVHGFDNQRVLIKDFVGELQHTSVEIERLRGIDGDADAIEIYNGNSLTWGSVMGNPIRRSARIDVSSRFSSTFEMPGAPLRYDARYLVVSDPLGFKWGKVDVRPSNGQPATLAFDHLSGTVYANEVARVMDEDYYGPIGVLGAREGWKVGEAANQDAADGSLPQDLWTLGVHKVMGALTMSLEGTVVSDLREYRVGYAGLAQKTLREAGLAGDLTIAVAADAEHVVALEDASGHWYQSRDRSLNSVGFSGALAAPFTVDGMSVSGGSVQGYATSTGEGTQISFEGEASFADWAHGPAIAEVEMSVVDGETRVDARADFGQGKGRGLGTLRDYDCDDWFDFEYCGEIDGEVNGMAVKGFFAKLANDDDSPWYDYPVWCEGYVECTITWYQNGSWSLRTNDGYRIRSIAL